MQRRAWQLSEQKLKNLLSQKERELHLANIKIQGLDDTLEDGGLAVEAQPNCSIVKLFPRILLRTRPAHEYTAPPCQEARKTGQAHYGLRNQMRDQLAAQLDELRLVKDENLKLKRENEQLRSAASSGAAAGSEKGGGGKAAAGSGGGGGKAKGGKGPGKSHKSK